MERVRGRIHHTGELKTTPSKGLREHGRAHEACSAAMAHETIRETHRRTWDGPRRVGDAAHLSGEVRNRIVEDGDHGVAPSTSTCN
jgi:hypothetical protein